MTAEHHRHTAPFMVLVELRKIIKNTEGTSGINACGVEGSGSEHVLNETIDIEARKIQGQFLEAHPF